MSSVQTYSAFHCNGCIVVMHQHGYGDPQTLTIFREPQRLATHEKKLIGFYALSNEAVTLLDDPQHDALAVLNAIALPMSTQHKTVLTRRLKFLASAVAGALLVSATWYVSPQKDTNGIIDQPMITTASQPVTLPLQPGIIPTNNGKQNLNAAPGQPGVPTPTAQTRDHAVQEESQNMQNALQDNRNALPASPAEALQASAPKAPSQMPAGTTAEPVTYAAPPVETQTTRRLQMAEVLKRNADRGMFTITLSSGHPRTLYAFLDPTCAVCRVMEPAIARLAQDYNVIVFPVSVVNDGGDAVQKIVPLLCQKDPAKRASGWQKVFRADAGMMAPGYENREPVDPECEKAAAAAVAVNDLGFRQFGFEGTPWVLTDTGFHLSTGLLSEPAKIDLFLKTTDPMHPEQADRFMQTINSKE